jgi:hypothetical protein
MIFVIETIDVVERPHDAVRPERTMSGPYPDVDQALALAEQLRETHRNAIVHILHEAPRLEPAEGRRRDRDRVRDPGCAQR